MAITLDAICRLDEMAALDSKTKFPSVASLDQGELVVRYYRELTEAIEGQWQELDGGTRARLLSLACQPTEKPPSKLQNFILHVSIIPDLMSIISRGDLEGTLNSLSNLRKRYGEAREAFRSALFSAVADDALVAE